MSTIRDVVNLARKPTNDSAVNDSERRVPDETFRGYVATGLLQAFRSRGDLFVGSFSTPPSLTIGLDDPFPLHDSYVQVLADYATARVQSHDDEHVNSGKAAAFYGLFGKEVS